MTEPITVAYGSTALQNLLGATQLVFSRHVQPLRGVACLLVQRGKAPVGNWKLAGHGDNAAEALRGALRLRCGLSSGPRPKSDFVPNELRNKRRKGKSADLRTRVVELE